MKITYMEVEATAEELKSTRSLSEALLGALNRAFGGMTETHEEEEEE